MSRFKLLYFVIFIINLYVISAQISDKRLCADEECKVPISLARTLLRYSSPDSRILSFAPNVDITIYSKSAGSREDLWGGEINGKRGYVPKHLVRETKVYQKPTILVDTEFSNDTGAQQVPSQVEPAKVQEPYEVVDGTTIYLNPQEDISPSSTENPIQPTALPVTEIKSDESKVASNEQSQPPSDTAEVNSNTESKEEIPAAVEEVSHETKNQEAPSENKIEATPPPQEAPKEVKPEEESSIEEKKEEVKISEAETKNEEPKLEEDTGKKEEPKLEEDTGKKEDLPKLEDTEKQKEGEVPEEGNVLTEEDDDEDDDDDDEDEDEEIEELEAVIEENGDDKEEETKSESIEAVPESTTIAPGLDTSEGIKEEINTEIVNVTAAEEKINADILPETTTHNINTDTSSETVTKEEVEKEIPPSPITENPLGDDQVMETSSIGSSNIQQEEAPKIETTIDEVKEEKVDLKAEESKEEVNIETTTLSPEFEVPQPFIDGSADVTPNPLEIVTEEVKVPENIIPTLPPLGLFGNQNLNVPTSENQQTSEEENTISSENEQTSEEEKSENITEGKKEEINDLSEDVSKESTKESKDFTFTEENKDVVEEQKEEVQQETEEKQEGGLFSGIFSMFSNSEDEKVNENEELTSAHVENSEEKHVEGDEIISVDNREQTCDATSCEERKTIDEPTESINMDLFNFNSDFLLYLVTTAISVIVFLFGYISFDKCKREGPLIAKINALEKEMLVLVKENQILQEKIAGDSGYDTNDRISNEAVENLKQELYEMTTKKNALEEQVQLLEKELENSTEVGMELNKMLSDILSSESGSDVLKANVEHFQRQLVEQQATINSINETLAETNTENHELRLELELSNKKVLDLQAELDKLLLNVLKIEEEKDTQQASLENEITTYRQKYEDISVKLRLKEEEYNIELKQLKNRLDQTERNLELKLKEHDILTDTIKQMKAMKSNDGPSLRALLDSSSLKAEVQQLKTENQRFKDRLQQEEDAKSSYEKRAQAAAEEAKIFKEKYDEADKLRVETETKLEVLSNYFKDREAQLQKEISKHESLWEEKQGETSSTTERIKFMQEQLQNYKSQTESLKQEIVSQEVELKSQISVLEKKAHENWVSARQAERKLEEAKQEAAQLRHRLTLRERAIQDDKTQHRFQSPVEQNGDLLVSSPIESPASPPLLYGPRDHITKSPPIPGLPPFLPPPPGVPFMPPPLPGVPPFIPPPPNMFPGDHRPPPLGRMSSPPLNSRYSPSSRGYSPYDRNSSSPSDSEYGTSPPQRRGYSPFNNRGEDRRDYKRPPPGRTNGRSMMKGGGSSGSGHSNESLDKVNRQQSKV